MGQSTAPTDEHQRAPLFYSEEETAALLGIHRTTLRPSRAARSARAKRR